MKEYSIVIKDYLGSIENKRDWYTLYGVVISSINWLLDADCYRLHNGIRLRFYNEIESDRCFNQIKEELNTFGLRVDIKEN